ncbi:MAG: RsmE family RNA methyltransferase, partial [Leptospira sp.]|nr:RsmE family RNA methyltransferase [Leptospira sp.]
MKTPIFFRPDQELTDEIILDKEEIAHLRSLRLNEEDKKIEIRDGNGCSAIYFLSKKSSKGTLESREIHKLHHKKFKIASAIPKSEKLNFLLQKGTELGISGFIFVNFSNSERKELNLI